MNGLMETTMLRETPLSVSDLDCKRRIRSLRSTKERKEQVVRLVRICSVEVKGMRKEEDTMSRLFLESDST